MKTLTFFGWYRMRALKGEVRKQHMCYISRTFHRAARPPAAIVNERQRNGRRHSEREKQDMENTMTRNTADLLVHEVKDLIKDTRTEADTYEDSAALKAYMDYAEEALPQSIAAGTSAGASEAAYWIKAFLQEELEYGDMGCNDDIVQRWLAFRNVLKEYSTDRETSMLDEMREDVRSEAISWNYYMAEAGNYNLTESTEDSAKFAKLGVEYGLLHEFQENGIC